MSRANRPQNGGSPRKRGFERAGNLVSERIRRAGESRGFAVSRLIIHWADVAGPDIAAVCRPISVGYARSGLGATLTLLTTGAQAPMLQLQERTIRDRVNACYGYAAISRIRITQTAPTGFAEGQTDFAPAPQRAKTPTDHVATQANGLAKDIRDPDLRDALSRLGSHILSKSTPTGDT